MTPALAGIVRRAGRHRHALMLVAVVAVAILGFVALDAVLREVHLRDVRASLALVPPTRIPLAIGLTAISYLALTLYDWAAVRAIGRPQAWRTTAIASFTSYTLSHNLGLSLLTGGSARYRVYRAAGLDLGDVAQVSLIASLTFWAGVIGVAAGTLIAGRGDIVLAGYTLTPNAARVIGVTLAAILATAPIARIAGVTSLGIGGLRIPLPELRLQGVCAGAAITDMMAASAALFVLMPALPADAFPGFLLAYTLAIIVALITHVPGGIGVFEAVVLASFPADRPAVFAALLLYRCVYYLLPLLLTAGLLVAAEGHRLRRPIARGVTLLDRTGKALAPTAVTVLVFIGGLVLLVSGALPGVGTRLSAIDDILPLPFIEGSHLAGSLVGTAMLLVAPALRARLRSGFDAARLLLLGGAIFSLLKGLDYEEALLQLGILAILQYSRPSFSRRGGVFTEPPAPGWIAAAAGALALSLWAGFFAYKRTPYADELWWRFAIDGNAPRFLRASFAAGIVLSATTMWQLLVGHRRTIAGEPLPEAIARAALAVSGRSDANLAFTGDKSFLVSASGDSFLMYRVHGRSWVVMGDPVGPRAAWDELIWSLRRLAHADRGRLCFFQASEAMLPLFVDLGLSPMKYGEEARIDIAGFTLAGPRAKPLRHALRRCDSVGAAFAIVPAEAVGGILPELKAISDAWLGDRHGTEKRFSLGAFDAAYLERFDCAVVRVEGRIVAFANIWRSGDGRELSIDLMRHSLDAPYGTMDMLIVRMIEWGGGHGFQRFNLGMAPLSGLRSGTLAPLWARLGHALFDNGERLYGFAGLRAFKAKFGPDWVPRFVATPPGIPTARGLIDIARLVSG